MPHPGGLDIEATFLGAMGASAAGAIGAFGLWLANRTLGKAAFQTAINDGFNKLLERVQKERDQLTQELENERAEAAKERTQLRGELHNLMQVVLSLKRLLQQHGIDIPPDLPLTPEDRDGVLRFLTDDRHAGGQK